MRCAHTAAYSGVAAWDTVRPGKRLDDMALVARGQIDQGSLVKTSMHKLQLHTSMLKLQQKFYVSHDNG